MSTDTIRRAIRVIRKDQGIKESIKYYAVDPEYRKMVYVRYADDFLIGFNGPKKEATDILIRIAHYLGRERMMKLSIEKSGVRHHKKGVHFLGYRIYGHYNQNIKYKTGGVQRFGGTNLKFAVPLEKLFKTYTERGFFQLAKKGKNKKYTARRVDK